MIIDMLISIHAPRVGSDDLVVTIFESFFISIHAPRVGSDAPARIRSMMGI